ncbi:hypothetical protein ACQ4PT_007314 [Festuca glaucescens]
MTCLCVPAVFLACAAPSTGHKTTGLLRDDHQQRKINTASGTRGKVFAARAGMSGMDRGRREGGGGRAPAGGVGMWALAASNLASIAFLLHQHYVNRPRASDDGSVPKTGSDDANGDAPAPPPPPPPPEPIVAPDAVINLELGDPTMYEAFWREAGERAEVVIPGCWGMSYTSDAGSLCWFLEPEFEREVRRLHRLVGNAAVDDGYHLVVGTGATQLFQAAMYALSPAGADRPVGVVSPAPYYSSYPPQTDLLLSGYYRWAGDANALDGGNDGHIELVCSPNNPDGAIREAVLSGKAIHDLVYYWPQYTPITGAAAHDIMLFTVSKITGHAGTRLGWALVRDRDVAKKMVYFVDRATIGVSRDSQHRAAKLLAVVSDAYDDDSGTPLRLFDFARRRMAESWRALRAAVAGTGGAFSLPEETTGYCNFTKQTVAAYPAFAWLRCEKDGVEDCAEFLRGHSIVARGGEQFGGDARCVRVNMLDRDGVFDILIQRISSITLSP